MPTVVITPPKHPNFSMIVTFPPARLAAMAAESPAGPPPTTRISQRAQTGTFLVSTTNYFWRSWWASWVPELSDLSRSFLEWVSSIFSPFHLFRSLIIFSSYYASLSLLDTFSVSISTFIINKGNREKTWIQKEQNFIASSLAFTFFCLNCFQFEISIKINLPHAIL